MGGAGYILLMDRNHPNCHLVVSEQVFEENGFSRKIKEEIPDMEESHDSLFSLFCNGFFTGFAPTGKSSTFSSPVATSNRPELAPQPLQVARQTVSRVYLRKLANTIKLVPPPLVWIVVEPQTESTEVSEILRKTGIMYRHLVSKENFNNLEAELNHQRNLALKHIEHHRLSGIVHFAGLSNVYDLEFFHHLRDIEMFGTWPMAMLKANRKNVKMEGPVCDSSQVVGWHLRSKNNETDMLSSQIRISSLAFNSSILWDPERWGRASPVQDPSQNSIKLVKQVILEDESKLKGIPPDDCSKILLWRFNFHVQPILKRQVMRISS
ncbi:hypothetical protein K1719_031781 [Acacia pycnantha]|nr:hypothetical protein K1719_031781 [Acacia pycnantha]